MEERALAASLHRLFPAHSFHCPARLDGFTSSELPPNYVAEQRRKPLLNLEKFAKRLLGYFAPGGRTDEPAPDFVIGIDDVELVNASAPQHITGALRSALADNLARWPCDEATRATIGNALATRCSFHLMAPMTEAYFFADPAAFARATDPGTHHPCTFDGITCDVENFYADELPFLTPPTPPRRDSSDWRADKRELHPKHYLGYLTDQALTGRGRYDEIQHGVPALAALDWPLVLRHDLTRTAPFARFARSLLADLVDMLDTPPLGITAADLDVDLCHSLTRRWPAAPLLLRNI
jgi:hypothetical protein